VLTLRLHILRRFRHVISSACLVVTVGLAYAPPVSSSSHFIFSGV